MSTGVPAQDLRIALVQGDTRWHDPAGNRAYYGEWLAPLAGAVDLVLLPETFTSGFSNDAIAQAEDMQGPTVAWLREQARALDERLRARLADQRVETFMQARHQAGAGIGDRLYARLARRGDEAQEPR